MRHEDVVNQLLTKLNINIAAPEYLILKEMAFLVIESECNERAIAELPDEAVYEFINKTQGNDLYKQYIKETQRKMQLARIEMVLPRGETIVFEGAIKNLSYYLERMAAIIWSDNQEHFTEEDFKRLGIEDIALVKKLIEFCPLIEKRENHYFFKQKWLVSYLCAAEDYRFAQRCGFTINENSEQYKLGIKRGEDGKYYYPLPQRKARPWDLPAVVQKPVTSTMNRHTSTEQTMPKENEPNAGVNQPQSIENNTDLSNDAIAPPQPEVETQRSINVTQPQEDLDEKVKAFKIASQNDFNKIVILGLKTRLLTYGDVYKNMDEKLLDELYKSFFAILVNAGYTARTLANDYKNEIRNTIAHFGYSKDVFIFSLNYTALHGVVRTTSTLGTGGPYSDNEFRKKLEKIFKFEKKFFSRSQNESSFKYVGNTESNAVFEQLEKLRVVFDAISKLRQHATSASKDKQNSVSAYTEKLYISVSVLVKDPTYLIDNVAKPNEEALLTINGLLSQRHLISADDDTTLHSIMSEIFSAWTGFVSIASPEAQFSQTKNHQPTENLETIINKTTQLIEKLAWHRFWLYIPSFFMITYVTEKLKVIDAMHRQLKLIINDKITDDSQKVIEINQCLNQTFSDNQVKQRFNQTSSSSLWKKSADETLITQLGQLLETSSLKKL